MTTPPLVATIDHGAGFPIVYIYEHKGELFEVYKSGQGWDVSHRDPARRWGENIASTRKDAIALAVAQIDWDTRPGVSPTELQRLIDTEPSR